MKNFVILKAQDIVYYVLLSWRHYFSGRRTLEVSKTTACLSKVITYVTRLGGIVFAKGEFGKSEHLEASDNLFVRKTGLGPH